MRYKYAELACVICAGGSHSTYSVGAIGGRRTVKIGCGRRVGFLTGRG